MSSQSFTLSSTDGHAIFVREWAAQKNGQHADNSFEPKGVVLISHGMAEHSLRYERLALEMNQQGLHVFAHDHRGHGHSMSEQQGLFSVKNGWQKVLQDMDIVYQHIKKQFPNSPLFLFGHSMGSFVSMSYIKHFKPDLAGFIASGSNYDDPLKYRALLPILKAEKLRLGAGNPSPIIEKITFGAFNARFKPAKTDSDWLSRDSKEVQTYLNDDLCGFFCSSQLWEDLAYALIDISTPKAFRHFPDAMPVYIFSGDKDPVGNFGTGVRALAKQFITGGSQDICLRLYPEGRHEMLNETNREQVTQDLINWIIKRL